VILLDSHVLLWLLSGRGRFGSRTERLLREAEAVHASAASVWELTIKSMLGKVRIPDEFESEITRQGLSILDVTASHGGGIRNYPEIARHDPFDRLLVSQAEIEGMRLVTADRVLLALRRPFILDAGA
jgi:PIN domain nuclease of toxin-antitoxin system